MTPEDGKGGKQPAFPFFTETVELVDPDTGASVTVPAKQVARGGPAQGAGSSADRPQKQAYYGTEAASEPKVYQDSKSPT